MGAGAASQPSRVPSPGGELGMLPLGGPASAPSLTYANRGEIRAMHTNLCKGCGRGRPPRAQGAAPGIRRWRGRAGRAELRQPRERRYGAVRSRAAAW